MANASSGALKQVTITGIGYYVPEKSISNQELIDTFKLDTTDAWIRARLGIEARRFARPDQQNSDLAVLACRKALAMAGLKPGDVEGIVMSPGFGDRRYPSTAPAVAMKLGVTKGFAIDVDVACTGFISCLQIGRKFIQDGTLKNCLIIGSDVSSRGVKAAQTDRTMGVIFGDGAAAVVIAPTESGGIIADYVETDGSQYELTGVRAGGSEFPLTQEVLAKGLHHAYMDGQGMWRNAVKRLPQAIERICELGNTKLGDIDIFVTHQANLRLMEAALDALEIPRSKTYTTIEKYGNSGNASMPVTLAEAYDKGLFKKGSLVCLAACGGGFSWGSTLIRWTC